MEAYDKIFVWLDMEDPSRTKESFSEKGELLDFPENSIWLRQEISKKHDSLQVLSEAIFRVENGELVETQEKDL